jgi:hypothetical protein
MLIFPVRHHSPAAALQVDRLIRARRPKAVLVEGPADADPLIPLLLDDQTHPPAAIYAYRTDALAGRVAETAATARPPSALYPFCRYSPEYAALLAGQGIGADLHFCDVPAAVALSWAEEVDVTMAEDVGDDDVGVGSAMPAADASPGRAVASDEERPGYATFARRLAEAAGFDEFDAFWEAAFEQAGGGASADDFIALLTEFGTAARASLAGLRQDGRDDLRERQMASTALGTVANGVAADDVLLVCGAAHAAAIARHVAAGVAPPDFGEHLEASLALIPFSYPRLSEQLGYGAGNRAPWYYEQVWRLGGDYPAATRRALVALAHGLRRRGHVASLAQAIDADRLGALLAQVRGKPGPGVDELRDAAIACFGQGNEAAVGETLREILIGREVGRVTPRAGRTPLQSEFYATCQVLRLPILDQPKQVLVHLPVPEEAAQSVFLHRLTTADVPFAHELEGGLGSGSRTVQGGPLRQLGRVREKWELCWSPMTDARLVERSAWGGTIAEVCERVLAADLARAGRVDDGADVLLRLALCDLPRPFPEALARCESLAADSTSFPALARAAFRLDGLLAYGAVRKLPEPQLADLAGRLFVRAALALPAAAVCGDEAARDVEEALKPLADLVRRGRTIAAPDVFYRGVAAVATRGDAHPGLRGLCLTLLELGGQLAPGELPRRLRAALAGATDAAANAKLVAGLFALHRGTLVRNRAVVGAVTDFLVGLEVEALIPLMPALRRSLGELSPAERRYLSETLAKLLGLDRVTSLNVPTPDEIELTRLREADALVAATLADWKDRYGIC